MTDARAWLTARYDAGFSGISLRKESGGRGLTHAHELAFELAEAEHITPPPEIWGIGHHMVIPAIDRFGDDELRDRLIVPGLRGELIFCQLFSEPDAGSDLAGLRTHARRDGDRWIVHGQKVWTSVAHVADYGMLLCRTDPSAGRHAGISCFMVPMDSPGVTVRSITQITGGHAFNEVFLDGVEVADGQRLGPVGGGWKVATATLQTERVSVPLNGPHASVARLIGTAQRAGRAGDPVLRQLLADVAGRKRLAELGLRRVHGASLADADPGPVASTLKLMATELFRSIGTASGAALGPELVADSGRWGTYAWNRQILETAGLRIGGGTDEIQRNILGERCLGLPREPRPPEAAG